METGARFDHYELLSLIGQGGMGEVWKARDTKLGRMVAIKFVRPTWATDSRILERLRVEARAASALNHPNICTIHDFREHEGRPLIVMELMNGQTLRARMSSTPLRIPEVVDIGIQVADALAAAHSHGIIHRDIKPDNVFLTADGFVKVLDFGLAKLLLQDPNVDSTAIPTSTLTTVGDVLGTVSYMSPEQASGEPLDSRTDLFSLGVVLYQCATGYAPFTGKTIAVLSSAILNKAPVPPMALNPDVPSRLQDVIYSCLEKDRELRCPSADNLRVQLKRVKRDLEFANLPSEAISLQDRGSLEVSGRATSSIPATPSVAAWSHQPHAHSRAVQVGIVLAAVVLISGALYWTLPRRSAAPENVTNVAAENPGEDLLQRASVRLSGRDYRGAAADASEVLRQTPGNAAAAALLEQARSELGRFDQSISDARRWLNSGDTQKAEQALEVARSIDPTAPEVATLSARLVGQLSAETRAAQESARQARDAARAPATPPAPARETQSPAAISTPPVSVPEAAQRPREEAPQAETQPVRTENRPTQTAPAAATTPPAVAGLTSAPARSVTSESVVRSPEASPPAQPAAAPPPPAAPQPPASSGRNGPVPASDEADRTAIRGVIDSYRQAIETQNLDLIRRIKPNLSAAEARRFTEGFRAVSSQKVDLTILSIELNGNNSIVKLNRRDTLQAQGAPAQSAVSQQTIHLIRTAGRWVIDAIGQ